jgi:preprotein translocase subunit SecF
VRFAFIYAVLVGLWLLLLNYELQYNKILREPTFAQARVIQIKPKSSRKTQVSYEFRAASQTYQNTADVAPEFQESEIGVVYQSSDPTNNCSAPVEKHRTRNRWIWAVLTAFTAVLIYVQRKLTSRIDAKQRLEALD